MTEILAADNHSIYTKDGKWRLIYSERPLAEASNSGFRYSGRFGMTRRLPEGGVIEQHDIQQVVLGWQATDESWHLGLILAPHLADQRGSRWCEIVRWPDPEITVFQDLAQESGQELAQSIGVPFYVIPPQTAEPDMPPRELPKLPLRFGDWEMKALASQEGQFLIKRRSSWSRRRIMKSLWHGFWALIYLLLSLATLFGDIALPITGTLLPDPKILPYLGIAISAGLLISALYQISTIFMTIDRIMVDGGMNTISAWRGKSMSWSMQRSEVQSLYVTEQVKKREQAPATEYGELNLHLGGGEFQFVLKQEEPQDDSSTPQPELVFSRTEGIRELGRELIHTDLQAAGLYISEALHNLPIWYDLRVK